MKIKKAVLSAILTAVLCFSGNLLAYSGDGDGTAKEPYQISSVVDWQELMASPSDWRSCFILTADINLAGVTVTPVGNGTIQFTGVFDGNDNVISNARINQPSSYQIGLFGYVSGSSQIHDLGVEDVNMTGRYWVGGLAGNSYGTLTGCYTTGSVIGKYHQSVIVSYVGGLVGANGGTITGCYTNSSVSYNSMTGYVGGLTGVNTGTLSDCYATGTVSGVETVGGLVGMNWYGGTITDCFATGSVSGADLIGGLVGKHESAKMISGCYATGSVTGWSQGSGGLAGYIDGGDVYAELYNCYASGSVNGEDYAGGLVGLISRGRIIKCYSTGSVSGDRDVGGLVAWINYGSAQNCFWDIETSGQTFSYGGTGKSTVEMKTLSTYTSAGWDFVNETVNGPNDIWTMHEDVDYPKHVWSLVNFTGWYEIDFADYSFFANQWSKTNCGDSNDCEGADFDFSDAIDGNDLKIFTDHWLR